MIQPWLICKCWNIDCDCLSKLCAFNFVEIKAKIYTIGGYGKHVNNADINRLLQ